MFHSPEQYATTSMTGKRSHRKERGTWVRRHSVSLGVAAHLAVHVGIMCSRIEAVDLESLSADFAVRCGADTEATGYKTLAQLNSVMRRDSLVLAIPDGKPKKEYVYNLCPQTVFNGNEQIQVPPSLFPYHPTIQCGDTGDSSDSCIIEGGDTQVFMMDNFYADESDVTDEASSSRSFTFQGLTFMNSEDISIAAMMSSPLAVANFVDCHWRNPQGTAAIFVSNYKALTEARLDLDTVIDEKDNIFRPNRNRQLEVRGLDRQSRYYEKFSDRNLLAVPDEGVTDKKGMTVVLSNCSFKHSFILGQGRQMQDFILFDIFGGRVELIGSTIDTGGGILVVNTVNGGYFKAVDTTITSSLPADFVPGTTAGDSWGAIATLRSHGSELQLVRSRIITDHHAVSTVAAVDQSVIVVSDSQFVHSPLNQSGAPQQSKQPLSQILVLASSKATITHSCFEGTETSSGSTVVVDNSSSLKQEHNGISLSQVEDESLSTENQMVEPDLPFLCDVTSRSNGIWILDSAWTCLEGVVDTMDVVGGNLRATGQDSATTARDSQTMTCSGTCQTMTRQSQCRSAPRVDLSTSGVAARFGLEDLSLSIALLFGAWGWFMVL